LFFLFNCDRDVGYDRDCDYDHDYDLDHDAGCDYDEEVVSIRLKMWRRLRRSRRGRRRDFHFLFLVPPVLVFAVSSFVDFRLMA
jgi:hypothetical protein